MKLFCCGLSMVRLVKTKSNVIWTVLFQIYMKIYWSTYPVNLPQSYERKLYIMCCLVHLLLFISFTICVSLKKLTQQICWLCYMLNLLLLLNCVKCDYTESLKSLFSKWKIFFLPPFLLPPSDNLILSCFTSLLLYNFLIFHMKCLTKSVSFLLHCDVNSKATELTCVGIFSGCSAHTKKPTIGNHSLFA